MDEIRKTLARDTILAFYDVRKSATIQTDASQSGLRCGLMQQGRPLAFASCALTDAEQNYSQIEKEMLAICFACTKFNQYIYGKCTDVQLEHRHFEEADREGITPTATYDYTVAALHPQRDVRAGETSVCHAHSFPESQVVEHQPTWKCSYTTW